MSRLCRCGKVWYATEEHAIAAACRTMEQSKTGILRVYPCPDRTTGRRGFHLTSKPRTLK